MKTLILSGAAALSGLALFALFLVDRASVEYAGTPSASVISGTLDKVEAAPRGTLSAAGDAASRIIAAELPPVGETGAARTPGVLDAITSVAGAQALDVAVFETPSGREFMLDREEAHARLVFSDTGEEVALREDFGRGGDVVLRDTDGRVVLRLTARGNAILYGSSESLGEPVTKLEATSLDPQAPASKPGGAG